MAYQFKTPTILTALTTVCIIALCLSLGQWQLKRADEKSDLIERHQRLAAAPPSELRELLRANKMDDLRYRNVQATVEFHPQKQFLLDNKVYQSTVGFNVLSPARLLNTDNDEQSQQNIWLLVDRGWVPLGKDREHLPDINMNNTSAVITGYLYTPLGQPFSLGDIAAGSSGWPHIIQYLDFPELSRLADLPLQAFVLRLSPESPGGYIRKWKITASSPNKSTAYAIQWFALAVVILILFVTFHLKPRKKATL